MARAPEPPLVPEAEQVFLDHAGLFVPDLAPVTGALERLGFAPTPLAKHGDAPSTDGAPAPSGTANICAMFRVGYLEVIGPTGEDTPLARQLADRLKRHPGLHLIAFSVAESPDHHARLDDAGFGPVSLVRLRRRVPTPDGEASTLFGCSPEPCPKAASSSSRSVRPSSSGSPASSITRTGPRRLLAPSSAPRTPTIPGPDSGV